MIFPGTYSLNSRSYHCFKCARTTLISEEVFDEILEGKKSESEVLCWECRWDLDSPVKEKTCECGGDSIGSPFHSYWCRDRAKLWKSPRKE